MRSPGASGPWLLARHERIWLAVLVCLHIGLGLYWNAVIPPFEAHDEVGHYYHVRYIARHGRLVPPGEPLVEMYDESRQPPLYYILAALPVSLINTDDGPPYTPNPYAGWGQALGGFNALVHDLAYEAFPWRGGVLALHVARAVSTLLGALTLLVTFEAARWLAPTQLAVRWGAVLGLALWPQFRFTSSVINNDNLVTLSGALMALALLRLLAATRETRLRWLVAVGVCAALAALAKNNGLQVAAVGVLVALWTIAAHARWHRWRVLLPLGAALGLAAVAVGWWYARNLASGQGALALPFMDVWVYQLRQLLGGQGVGPGQLLGRFATTGRFAWRSLWAAFGWGNVGYPAVIYWLGGCWCLVGLCGVVVRPSQGGHTRIQGGIAALGLIVAAIVLPTWLLYVATGIPYMQGRYLLPALPAFVMLMALGWDRLLPQRFLLGFWSVLGGALLLLAVMTPFAVIAPAYAPPKPLAADELAQHTPTLARFGDVVELVGYQLPEPRLDAAGALEVRLALRVLARSDLPLTLAVKAYDVDGRLVGSVHRYPGRGALDTTKWEPGLLFEERMALPIAAAAGEGAGRLEISFYQADAPLLPLVVRDGSGTRLGRSLALLEAFRIRDGAAVILDNAVAHRWGGVLASSAPVMTFDCVDGRAIVRVTWTWRVERELDADYRLSLQLRSPDDTMVAQRDGPLADGRVPTRLWEVGEVVPEQALLTLPRRVEVAPLTLYLIVYDPLTETRLPLAEPDGQATGDDELFLGSFGPDDLAGVCAKHQ